MPKCLLDNRAIDRAVRRIGQGTVPDGYGNRDHIVPLSDLNSPGDIWSNVRAAHTLCNGQAVTYSPRALHPIPDPFRSDLLDYLLATPQERPAIVGQLCEGNASVAGLLLDLEADDNLRTRLETALSEHEALWREL